VRGPVVIGGSSSVGDGSLIEGPSVIGAGCVIEPGAIVRECILGDYTRVASLARLDRVLVFGNECIQPTGEYFGIAEAGIGWVVDDARVNQEFGPEQMELLDTVRQLAD
jgi:mannose-1-phosphate guanylyltransferase